MSIRAHPNRPGLTVANGGYCPERRRPSNAGSGHDAPSLPSKRFTSAWVASGPVWNEPTAQASSGPLDETERRVLSSKAPEFGLGTISQDPEHTNFPHGRDSPSGYA